MAGYLSKGFCHFQSKPFLPPPRSGKASVGHPDQFAAANQAAVRNQHLFGASCEKHGTTNLSKWFQERNLWADSRRTYPSNWRNGDTRAGMIYRFAGTVLEKATSLSSSGYLILLRSFYRDEASQGSMQILPTAIRNIQRWMKEGKVNSWVLRQLGFLLMEASFSFTFREILNFVISFITVLLW